MSTRDVTQARPLRTAPPVHHVRQPAATFSIQATYLHLPNTPFFGDSLCCRLTGPAPLHHRPGTSHKWSALIRLRSVRARPSRCLIRHIPPWALAPASAAPSRVRPIHCGDRCDSDGPLCANGPSTRSRAWPSLSLPIYMRFRNMRCTGPRVGDAHR